MSDIYKNEQELADNSLLISMDESNKNADRACNWLKLGRKIYCIGRNNLGVIIHFYPEDYSHEEPVCRKCGGKKWYIGKLLRMLAKVVTLIRDKKKHSEADLEILKEIEEALPPKKEETEDAKSKDLHGGTD